MRTLCTLVILMSLLGAFGAAHAATVATADANGGYSTHVMDSVLEYWTTPKGSTKGPLRVILVIDAEGELQKCRVLSSSGLSSHDDAACAAARYASPFMTPPNNMPIDVHMSFWTGRARATKSVLTKGAKEREKKPAEPVQSAEYEQSVSEKAAEENTLPQSNAEQSKAEETPVVRAPESSHSMTHAGIDYSRPRATPSGVLPLGDMGHMQDITSGLVGAKLPPTSEEKGAEKGEQKSAVKRPKKAEELPYEKGIDEDLRIKLDPEPATEPKIDEPKIDDSAEQDMSEPEAQEEDAPKPYAEGMEPFIQENRKGQIMDENDYYVEGVIRKIRALVEFPLELPGGVVSASLIMNVNANGSVQGVELSKSTRNPILDEALLTAARKITKLPEHPSGKAQELYLILIVQTP